MLKSEKMFSVAILTLNEERDLPGCLDSLAGCDDIVVLDSGSSDRTADIAKEKGARVFTRPFDNYAAQRNAAMIIGAKTLSGDGRVAVVAPQLNLMEQGAKDARRLLDCGGIVCISGAMTAEERQAAYAAAENKIIFLTPQAFTKDASTGSLVLTHKDLLLFDDADQIVKGDQNNRRNFMWRAFEAAQSKCPSARRGFLSSAPAPDSAELSELLSKTNADLCCIPDRRRPIERQNLRLTNEKDPEVTACGQKLDQASRVCWQSAVVHLAVLLRLSKNPEFAGQVRSLQESCETELRTSRGGPLGFKAELELKQRFQALNADFNRRTQSCRNSQNVRMARYRLGCISSAVSASGSIRLAAFKLL